MKKEPLLGILIQTKVGHQYCISKKGEVNNILNDL